MKNMFSLFLFIFSGYYLSIAFSFPMFSKGIPGSGFFPQIIGVALVILTGFDLIKHYRENKSEAADRIGLKEMLMQVAICTLYIFLFNMLGAILSTILFTIATLLLFNKGKWKQNIVIGLAVPLVIFFLFEYLLQTGLPKGIFENII
ncbi:MAG TPA: tripartite tricarboxylate transporter TctB family protein [Bacillaceae bacterium]